MTAHWLGLTGHGRDGEKQMDSVSFGCGGLAEELNRNLNALPEIPPIRNSLHLQTPFIKMQIHLRGLGLR